MKLNWFSKNTLLQIALITVAGILAFSNIFDNEFLIDDKTFISEWEASQKFEIVKLVKGDVPGVHEGVYRPIRSILYSVYYQIWQDNPFGYHLHSLVVHLISTLFVYLVVTKILKNSFAGFIAALLFGLHPIHTESITYIAASMEMTGAAFFFASFYFYLKGKGKSTFYFLSVLFAFLAFFTYEMTLTLPVLIVLYESILGKRELSRKEGIKNYVPYFVLAGFYFIVRFLIGVGIDRGDYLGYSFYQTQLAMVKVWVKYIWLLINPTQISYIHNIEDGFESFMTYHSNIQSILSQSIFDLDILASIGVLAGLLFITIKFWKKQPIISFSILWFFISLLPVAYIFPQGIAIAEKYLYISSFGFILLVTYLIFNQFSKPKFSNFKFKIIVAVLITTSYGYLTYQRNLDWHDPITFWNKVVKQHPQSALGHYTLGVFYSQADEEQKAEEHYLKSVQADNRFTESYYNLGNLYARQGITEKALEYYQKTLFVDPNFEPAKIQNQKILENEEAD